MELVHRTLRYTHISVVAVFIFGCLTFVSSNGASDNAEYCELEVFKKSCAQDEVIMMTSAFYGRMALGRCVTQDFGIGCKADVLPVMDGFCSGRKQCSVNTVSPTLVSAKTTVCPRDGSAYLSASFKCVKVIQHNNVECQSKGNKLVKVTSGYIPSSESDSSACAYNLEASKNRKVNVTMLSFPPTPSIDKSGVSSSACYEVGSIRDGDKSKTIHKCLNDPRHKQLYLSNGGQVEIDIPHKESRAVAGHFLIHFEVSGCPNLQVPDKANLKIIGQTAKVSCTNSNQEWELFCEGDKWKGTVGECTSDNSGWSFLGLFDHEHPFGTAIVVGIGATLGVLTGGILLYIIIAIFKRCQKSDYVMTYEYTDPSFAHIPTDYHADKSNLLLQDDKLFEQNSNTWGSQRHGNSNTLSRGGGTDHSRVPLPPLPNDNNTLSYEKPLYNRNGNV